jgi:DNA-binding MarR family transcriptional regulator
MNTGRVDRKQLQNARSAIEKSHLLRFGSFADQIDRFVHIRLKKRLNWVKILALLSLIYAGGARTPSELGKHLLRSKDHVTRLVDGLVKDGLAVRSPDGKDRRSVQVEITSSGLQLVKRVLADIKKEEAFLESCLGERDFPGFEKLLRAFRHNLITRMSEGLEK